MKISVAWVFQHIDAEVKKIDINTLVARFNQATAEIEHVHEISWNFDLLSLAKITAITDTTITVLSDEWRQEYTLNHRPDAHLNNWFLIRKRPDRLAMGEDYGEIAPVSWVSSTDLGAQKDFIVPALSCDASWYAGSWKQHVSAHDYILDIDNKSITHRPDLWGHYGIAREIAALLDLRLKPLHYPSIPLIESTSSITSSTEMPFSIKVKDQEACKRFAGLYIGSIENKPSLLTMALAMIKVDAKPINLLVDATNYVMLDIGQPMHAFDADKILTKVIAPRYAKNQDKLTLLDGQMITLTAQDFVISDDVRPIALAGIMGGKDSAITIETTALFLEAASFDPIVIRQAALRHKLRTDASARFEKNLDPHQTIVALMYYVSLLQQAGVNIRDMSHIAVIGNAIDATSVTVTHEFIENKLGVAIDETFIISTLERLGSEISVNEGVYTIRVPTWRATKDLTIKEDIVEEIGRFFGYSSIKPMLPYKQTEPSDLSPVYRVRNIKQHLAFGLTMHELSSYSLFDQDFLQQLSWQPEDAVTIKNPVSETWQRLVTTLAPNLFKAIAHNKADHDILYFFEWGRVWQRAAPINEHKSLAGIFFHKKSTIDFYQMKAKLASLFELLGMPVTWHSVSRVPFPWYSSYTTAALVHEKEQIGFAGLVDPLFLRSISEGSAFIFELQGDYIVNYKQPVHRYTAPSKYQEVERDISMLVHRSITVASLVERLKKISPLVLNIELVDFFEKPEWQDKRSITIRITMSDPEKTLTKTEIDLLYNQIVDQLTAMDAIIR